MKFRLEDVDSWHSGVLCVCTALSAITGMKPDQIAQLISNEALKRGASVSADPGTPFNINHWLPLIRHLGGDYTQSEDFEDRPYSERRSISEFIDYPQSDDVILVFAENESEDMTHVFAMSDGYLVDTYTDGKKVFAKCAVVPAGHNNFRVKRVFLVWSI